MATPAEQVEPRWLDSVRKFRLVGLSRYNFCIKPFLGLLTPRFSTLRRASGRVDLFQTYILKA